MQQRIGEDNRLLQSLVNKRDESRKNSRDQAAKKKEIKRRCASCEDEVARIIEQGGVVETFCLKRSVLFDTWVDLGSHFRDVSWLLGLAIAAEDVPTSVQECTDKQKRFLAYRVIHDGIYGRYKNEKRPRVPLPPCVIKQVRQLWPQDVSLDDMIAAGHDVRSVEAPELEE